mmetsp:Transcript_21723/g.64052  ORF Transcript_21723/g.64052 Transcript_21723/m.64052 type:complete len:220 (+) Transcript_21723:241-900(+)
MLAPRARRRQRQRRLLRPCAPAAWATTAYDRGTLHRRCCRAPWRPCQGSRPVWRGLRRTRVSGRARRLRRPPPKARPRQRTGSGWSGPCRRRAARRRGCRTCATGVAMNAASSASTAPPRPWPCAPRTLATRRRRRWRWPARPRRWPRQRLGPRLRPHRRRWPATPQRARHSPARRRRWRSRRPRRPPRPRPPARTQRAAAGWSQRPWSPAWPRCPPLG